MYRNHYKCHMEVVAMQERMTWTEIKEKYPEQWIGLADVDNPKILIEVSYMVTTGSGQTTKQRDEHQTRLRIDDYNRNNRENVIFVNFIDGAGWLGRQSDLRLLYEDSDYVVNLKHLDSLEEVIKSYL